MPDHNLPEVWLRGPQPDFAILLQPIAFALMQAREDLNRFMAGFPDHLLYELPGGAASPAFHLQHLSGVLDRMFTYAEGKALNEIQLKWLDSEGKNPDQYQSVAELIRIFNEHIDNSLQKLKNIDLNRLTDSRYVGRKQLPSTVFGLLFHAAEHTQRHVGQLLVTAKVLQHS